MTEHETTVTPGADAGAAGRVSVAAGLPADVRRSRILGILEIDGFARVTDLTRRFGVSEVTIRNDLDTIGQDHPVQRVHGGAVLTSEASERTYEQSLISHATQKAAIGGAAAALVHSGQTVILDVGTTTSAVARALVERRDLEDVLVVTNGLSIALALEPAIPRLNVLVTGGTVRPMQHSLVEPYASRIFADVHADLAFIGCTGVDPEQGVTNVNFPETELKLAMVRACERAVVVADSSKLGVSARGRICYWDSVWTLVTDRFRDQAQRDAFAGVGVELVEALRSDDRAVRRSDVQLGD